MKTIIILLAACFSFSAFAGGSGGGGVLKVAMAEADAPKIIFAYDSTDTVVRFAYAHYIDNSWNMKRYEISTEVFLENRPLQEAFNASLISNGWAVVR